MDMPTVAELAALRKHSVDQEAVKPVGATLLVRLEVPKEITKGGIFLPAVVTENASYQADRGEVVAMGADAYKGKEGPDNPFPSGPWCKIGDTVLFGKAEGHRLTIDGAECRLIGDTRIKAVIER